MKDKTLAFLLGTVLLLSGCGNQENENQSQTISMAEVTTESANARAIAQKGIQALKDKNPDNMAKYLDFEVWYFAANHELADEETVAENLKNSDEQYNGLVAWEISSDENIEFGLPEEVDVESIILRETNQSVFLGKEAYDNFVIDKAYRVPIKNSEEIEKNEYYVIRINCSWKLDIAFSMDKEYHDMIVQFALSGK